MGRRNRFRVISGGRRWETPEFYLPKSRGRRRTGRTEGKGWPYYAPWIGLVGAGIAAGWIFAPSDGEAVSRSSGVTTQFGFCHTGGGTNCVVDGDTLWIQGVKVRVADIDAPETHDPRCASEKALGDRATLRLRQLVNSGTVTLRPIERDEDRYGRKLRIVEVDGTSVGDTLVGEGLARWYEGGRKPWC